MIQKKGIPQEVETVGAGDGGTMYVVVSALLVGVLIYVVRKYEKEHHVDAATELPYE
jgi:predicted transporter